MRGMLGSETCEDRRKGGSDSQHSHILSTAALQLHGGQAERELGARKTHFGVLAPRKNF